MSRGRVTHYDATKPGDVGRTGFCGWIACETETDLTKVTCRTCRKLFASGATERKTRALKPKGDSDKELSLLLQAKAPPPPKLNAAMWAGSCKGAEHRRCGDCALCVWERTEANRWGDVTVSAHNDSKEHRVERAADAPRWGSLSAALVALADWFWHDRHSPSAMGGILARIKSGEIGGMKSSKGSDPLMRRYDDLAPVESALARAYPESGHAKLTAAQCKGLLLVRTKGLLVVVPTYEELVILLGVGEDDMKAVVRTGRDRVSLDLFERGLIPKPKMGARTAREGGSRCLAVQTTTT